MKEPQWLSDCYDKADTKTITEKTGLKFEIPDIPDDVVDARTFVVQSRRDWIEANRDEILAGSPSQGDPAIPRIWKATDLSAATRIDWLAANRIPMRAITYMLGPEGIGKSLFLVWLIAIVTRGHAFGAFGIPKREPQVVVLVLTEDDWSTVARSRLEKAGADLEFLRVICTDRDGSGAPTFPLHMDIMAEAADGAALVIVDAWADTLPSSLTVKDPQHARRALHPWKELATKHNVAVLLSGHTNRQPTGDARGAYGLTGELRKKARMTLLAQPDPDDETGFLIGPEKSNLTSRMKASKFVIKSVQSFEPTADSDGTVPVLEWVGDSEQSAREHFAEAADKAAEREGKPDDNDAVDVWLLGFLAAGPQRANDVYAAADANGFSKDKAKRSKVRLYIEAKKDGAGPWLWSKPTTAVSPSLGAQQGSGQEPRVSDVLPLLPLLPTRSEALPEACKRAREQGSATQEHGQSGALFDDANDPGLTPRVRAILADRQAQRNGTTA